MLPKLLHISRVRIIIQISFVPLVRCLDEIDSRDAAHIIKFFLNQISSITFINCINFASKYLVSTLNLFLITFVCVCKSAYPHLTNKSRG